MTKKKSKPNPEEYLKRLYVNLQACSVEYQKIKAQMLTVTELQGWGVKKANKILGVDNFFTTPPKILEDSDKEK